MTDPKCCFALKALRLAPLLAITLAATGTGCISNESTVYRDETRMKVAFENDTAGRLFYEALSQMKGRRSRSESRTHVSIPVVFSHTSHVVEGENGAFNEAVRRCDTNGDGRITEQEAHIFADQLTPP
jgi:hypothetical protein